MGCFSNLFILITQRVSSPYNSAWIVVLDFYLYSFVLLVLGIFLSSSNLSALLHLTVQAGIALTAACVPVLGNILHLADVGPFESLDPTPFSLAITGLILSGAQSSMSFLILSSCQRKRYRIHERWIYCCGYSNSIVDVNRAVLELAGKTRKEVLGKTNLPFRRRSGASMSYA